MMKFHKNNKIADNPKHKKYKAGNMWKRALFEVEDWTTYIVDEVKEADVQSELKTKLILIVNSQFLRLFLLQLLVKIDFQPSKSLFLYVIFLLDNNGQIVTNFINFETLIFSNLSGSLIHVCVLLFYIIRISKILHFL